MPRCNMASVSSVPGRTWGSARLDLRPREQDLSGDIYMGNTVYRTICKISQIVGTVAVDADR